MDDKIAANIEAKTAEIMARYEEIMAESERHQKQAEEIIDSANKRIISSKITLSFARNTRSDYAYWKGIMKDAEAILQEAKELSPARAIECLFEWLETFGKTFDNDAWEYDHDGWEYIEICERFTTDINHLLHDHPELREAVTAGYARIDALGTFDDYGFLNISKIVKSINLDYEPIDHYKIYQEKKALKEKLERLAAYNLITDYEFPDQKYYRVTPFYPVLGRTKDLEGLAAAIDNYIQKKIYPAIARGDSKNVVQRIDGFLRQAHSRALKGQVTEACLYAQAMETLLTDSAALATLTTLDPDFPAALAKARTNLTNLSKAL